MPARVAEHLAEQLTRAVDHLRLPGEAGRGGDEADDLDHPGHRVEARPAACTAASALSAQIRATGRLSASTCAPTLPLAGNAPPSIGSWPEVYTSEPVRTAGT